MEEGPRREGPPDPPQRKKNAAVLCSCGEPARMVVVPTSYMPGQRCWRCANPHVQCEFVLWHGPWVNENYIIAHDEFLQQRTRPRAPAPVPDSGRSTHPSASSSTTAQSKEQDQS